MKDRKLEEYARTIEGSVKHFQTKNSLVLAGTEDEEEKQDDFSEDKTSYIDMLSVKGSSGKDKPAAGQTLREALAGAARARMEFYDAKSKGSASAALLLSAKLNESKPKPKQSKPAKGNRASGPSSVGQDDEEDEDYAGDPTTLLKLKEAENENLELQIELAKLKG